MRWPQRSQNRGQKVMCEYGSLLLVFFRGNRSVLSPRYNYSFFMSYRFLVNRHSKQLRTVFRRRVSTRVPSS